MHAPYSCTLSCILEHIEAVLTPSADTGDSIALCLLHFSGHNFASNRSLGALHPVGICLVSYWHSLGCNCATSAKQAEQSLGMSR